MPRWNLDDVDVACESWAHQWVRHFGRDPDRASQYIGPLGCTLGRVRELHDGASSTSERGNQHFPELFLGVAQAVNAAAHAMSLRQRAVLFRHYIGRWYEPGTWARRSRPVKQSIVAADLGVSLSEYYTRRDCAKECVRTVLLLGRTERPQETSSAHPLPSSGREVQHAAVAAG